MEVYSLTLSQACSFLGISRPTAKKWIESGRLSATKKDPKKRKSPYLVTRKACIAALDDPMHTVMVSAGDEYAKEDKCHYSAEVMSGTAVTQRRKAKGLRSLLGQRTESKLRSCMTSGKLSCGE